jgi:hypothetical protein
MVIDVPFSRTYRDKILMRLSPYEKTIFLDSDTHVLDSLAPLFALLDRFQLFFQAATGGRHYTLDGIPMAAFPEPSAGIVGWRRSEGTERFFEIWEEQYDKQRDLNGEGAWDQRSLRAAAWLSGLNLTFLQGEWQVTSFAATTLLWPARILHARGAIVNKMIREVNRVDDYRVYVPKLGCLPLHRTRAQEYARFSWRSGVVTLKTAVRSFLHYTGIWRRPINTRRM